MPSLRNNTWGRGQRHDQRHEMMQQYHSLRHGIVGGGRGEGGVRGGGRWGRDHNKSGRKHVTSGPKVCAIFAPDKGCKNASVANNNSSNKSGLPQNGAGMPQRPNNLNDVGVYAAMGQHRNILGEERGRLEQSSPLPIIVSAQVVRSGSDTTANIVCDKSKGGNQLLSSTTSCANDVPVAVECANVGKVMTNPPSSRGILAGIVAAQRGDVAMAEVFTGSATDGVAAAAAAGAVRLDNDVVAAGVSTVNVKIEQTNTTTTKLGNIHMNLAVNAALLTDSSSSPTSINGEGKSLIPLKKRTLPQPEHSPLSTIRHIDSSLEVSFPEAKTARLMSKKTSLPLLPTPPTKKICSKYSSPSDPPPTFAIPTATMTTSTKLSSLDMVSKIYRNGKSVYARKDIMLSDDYYPGTVETHKVIEKESELNHVVYNVRFKDGDLVEDIEENFVMSRKKFKKLNSPASIPTVGNDKAGETKLSAAGDEEDTNPSPLTACNSTESNLSSPSKFAKADFKFAKADGLPDGWIVRSNTNKEGRIVKVYLSPIKSYNFNAKVQAQRFVGILQKVNGDEEKAKKLFIEEKTKNVRKLTTAHSSVTSNNTLMLSNDVLHTTEYKSISDNSELSITESRESDDITTASDLLSVGKRFKCKMDNCQKWTNVEGRFCELHAVSTKPSTTKKKKKSTDMISPRPSKKQKVFDDQPPAEVQPAVQAMIEGEEEEEEERHVNQSAVVIKINDDEIHNFCEQKVANADEFMHIYDDVVTKLTSARTDDDSTAIAFYDHLTSYFITKMNYGDFCLGFDKDFIIRIIHDFGVRKQKLNTATEGRIGYERYLEYLLKELKARVQV